MFLSSEAGFLVSSTLALLQILCTHRKEPTGSSAFFKIYVSFPFPSRKGRTNFMEELPWCESSLWLSSGPNGLLLVIILRQCSFKARRRRNPPFSAALGHIRQRAGGSRSPLHGEGSGGLCSAPGSPETRSPAASTALLPREPPRAAALAH